MSEPRQVKFVDERLRVECILCDLKTGSMTYERALELLTPGDAADKHRAEFTADLSTSTNASEPRPSDDVVVLVKDEVPSFAPRVVNQAKPQHAGGTSAPLVCKHKGTETYFDSEGSEFCKCGFKLFGPRRTIEKSPLAEPATPKPPEGGTNAKV